MTIGNFITDCAIRDVPLDTVAIKKICRERGILTIRNGVAFSNPAANNILRRVLSAQGIPDIYSWHTCTLVSYMGREYCLVSLYHSPESKAELSARLRENLNEIFKHGIERSELGEIVEVWENGIYDSASTIGILVPGSILYGELLNSFTQIFDHLSRIETSELDVASRDHLKQVETGVIDIYNAIHT